MERHKKAFKYAFFFISLMIIVIFLVVFLYQYKKMGFLESFLTGASTAGFFGLLGQLVLTLVQEYYQRKTFKVCYLCRESSFSEEIEKGIKEFFSKKTDVEYHTKIISKGPNEKQEFLDFLSKKSRKYDGLIIRPIGDPDDFVHIVKELVLMKKEIVLVDLNFSKAQIDLFPSINPPLYVGSDFTYGGQLVANRMCDFIEFYGKESIEIIALLGPEEIPSSRKRCQSIVWELSKKKYTDLCTFINLHTFDKQSCSKELNDYLNEIDIEKFRNKNLILFCANDVIAMELMRQQLLQENSNLSKLSKICKSVHYIGYDGIKDNGNTYLLDRYSLSYTTIDVLPTKQGETAAEFILESLMNSKTQLKIQQLIKPKSKTNFHLEHSRDLKKDTGNEDNVDSNKLYTIETVYRA